MLTFLKAVEKGRYRRGAGSRLRKLIANKEQVETGVVACFCCGMPIAWRRATIEHITAKSCNGKDTLENFALSHSKCNELRGNTNSPRAAIVW